MIGWIIIVSVLLVAYLGELIKGERTPGYFFVFSLVTVVPAVVCLVLYFKDKENPLLRFFIIFGYNIMYIFVLLTGNTTMVFTYVLPMLTLIVLYHQPKLVLIMGGISLAANLLYAGTRIASGEIGLSNSRDIEIQIALIVLCFGFLYVASKMYDDIERQNQIYIKKIDEKNNEIQRVTLQTITTIANIIDAKDEYTKGHSQRVAEYSAAIAKAMGYGEEEVRNVRFIGLLHDIGKIGIPDAILNKPGRLNEEEFHIMKQHVTIGGNILKGNNMIKDLEMGARFHHERYDGKGYAEGLKGEQIPEIARIIGLADAYDAMTSNRIYRRRLPNEEVIEEMRECGGTQFDPKITEVFITLLKENKIEQLSPDTFVNPENLSEQSTQLLKNVIELQNKSVKDKNHDYLTEAYTREYGIGKIKGVLKNTSGALVITSIANLHEINGIFGYISGDYLIKTVSDTILEIPGVILSRYKGNELLGFFPAIKTPESAETEVKNLYEKLKSRLNEHQDYMNAQICLGCALTSSFDGNYEKIAAAAEKALYFKKETESSGWHIYKTETKQKNDIYEDGQNLSCIIERIKKGLDEKAVYDSDYPEFAGMIDYIKDLESQNINSIYMVLFTAAEEGSKDITVSARDEAMEYLKKAVRENLYKVDMIMRLNSAQYVLFFVNMQGEEVELIIERIISLFYKIHSGNTITINYECEELRKIMWEDKQSE